METISAFSAVILAAIVHASLQVGLGALLLLYHSSLGRHVSRKTRGLVSCYIAGMGSLVLLALAAIVFFMGRYFEQALFPEELIIVVGTLMALAVAMWGIYYRRGRSTELWLPRTVARFIDKRAKETNSNTEAFSLGMLTSLAEMPFSLALVVVAGNSILALPGMQQVLAVALYTAIAILPTVVMRIAIRRGQTVVDIQRWRVRYKTFLRLVTGAGFLVLALYIFAFEVLV